MARKPKHRHPPGMLCSVGPASRAPRHKVDTNPLTLEDVRKRALAKLTADERTALGLTD